MHIFFDPATIHDYAGHEVHPRPYGVKQKANNTLSKKLKAKRKKRSLQKASRKNNR